MPTLKKRLNLTLPAEIDLAITKLAKRDALSQSSKALSLIELALEIEEDRIWNQIAAARDKQKVRYVSHTKAWR